MLRLASSLAAALPDRPFEHPAKCVPIVQDVQTIKVRRATEFFRSLLGSVQASVSLRSFGDARPQDKSGLVMS